jgi:hypothetical protein
MRVFGNPYRGRGANRPDRHARIFEPKNRLDQAMVRAAWESLEGAAPFCSRRAAARWPNEKTQREMQELARRRVKQASRSIRWTRSTRKASADRRRHGRKRFV